MDWSWLPEYSDKLISGFWLTIQLLVICSTLGFALAVPVGLCQVTGPRYLALIARGFCTVVRGTPLLIQLYVIYCGFPVFPVIGRLNELECGVLALDLNARAYMSEIIRSGVESIPKGQVEAAQSVGMT